MNNEVEYETPIADLTLVQSLVVKQIKDSSDSQLIVQQLLGSYKTGDLKMTAYLELAKKLRSTFKDFEIEQIPDHRMLKQIY